MEIYRQQTRTEIDGPYTQFWGAWHQHEDGRWAFASKVIPNGADSETEQRLRDELEQEWPDKFERLISE